MNELLPYPIDTKKAKKLFLITMLLFCLAPVIINCVVLVPIYASLSTNAAYSGTIFPVIIKYIQDFFDLTAFSVSYALIIFSTLLISKRHSRNVIILYLITFFIKIPIRLFMNIPIYGSLGSATDITIDLIYMGVYFVLEVLQLIVICFFATTDLNKYLKLIAFTKEKKGKKKGQKLPTEDLKVLPISKIFNFYNPLQSSALKMSILICGIKIITRIINDITIGAPSSFGEILVMAVYYLSDILYGVVAYITAILVFNTIYEKLKKNDDKKTDEDNSPSVLDI